MGKKGKKAKKKEKKKKGHVESSGRKEKKREERETRRKLKKERKRRENASDMEKLNDQLRAKGLGLRRVAPDGNCLFRSVADQMEGCPMNYATYRKFACDYMVKTRAQFEPFFVPDDEIESFDDYIANMRTNGTWGTQLELKAIADGLERHLVVWQVDQARWMIRSCTVLKAECIHLGYTGGVHYDSVRRLDDSDLDMKPKPLSADGKDVDSERKKDSSKDESKCQFLMKSSCCPNEDHVKRVLLLHNGRVEDALKQLLQEREECEGEWSKTNEVVELKPSAVAKSDDQTSTKDRTARKIRKKKKKISRNKNCPCGSRKKYKNCCGASKKKKKKPMDSDDDDDDAISRAMETLCV